MLSPQLVTPDSSLADSIRVLEQRWFREFGGKSLPWDEAWLWPPLDGYALFERHPSLPWIANDPEYWTLHRVWLRKDLRRQGLLRSVWPLWRDRDSRRA